MTIAQQPPGPAVPRQPEGEMPVIKTSLFAPLRGKTFRTIWLASLLTNFGQLIQGVGAAWEMTRLTASADTVALVQTAVMLPLMLVSLPAGAFADMYDRRKVALAGLAFAFISATTLTTVAAMGGLGPWRLLSFCFLIGCGVALYSPAWQSSVGEQVKPEELPPAIALTSISYNVARSFGPALGGVIVAAAGAVAAFGTNALLCLPLVLAMLAWRRVPAPSRLPPERIDRAIVSGARYAFHSPPIRVILIRTMVSGVAGASVSALTPLVAKQLLGGGASTYGVLLGAFGVGAVIGATMIDRVRSKLDAETGVRLSALAAGLSIVIVGTSRNMALTCATLTIGGAAWTLLIALFNVGVQLSAPRWVAARALALYNSAITGGIAFGAWIWGDVAGALGVGPTMIVSGGALMLTAVIGLVLRMPHVASAPSYAGGWTKTLTIGLALTARSGPINIEIDYRVEPELARKFYDAMQQVRRVRLRTGGFDWSLARDISDPALWTERYHCPTWGDYLHQRSRATVADQEAQERAEAFNTDRSPHTVRRRLERPFGSVRWKADTPDLQVAPVRTFPP